MCQFCFGLYQKKNLYQCQREVHVGFKSPYITYPHPLGARVSSDSLVLVMPDERFPTPILWPNVQNLYIEGDLSFQLFTILNFNTRFTHYYCETLPHYLYFVRGIPPERYDVCVILARTNWWTNFRVSGDWRHYDAHETPLKGYAVFAIFVTQNMMTSSNGSIFRVTGLCAGNSPVPGEFRNTKDSDA